MDIKEINQLRKDGRLAEAQAAAEAEFAANVNTYTVSALFWCLYDQSKLETDPEVLHGLLGRMQELSEYEPENEYMQASVERLKNRLDPLRNEIAQAAEKAKNGQVDLPLLARLRSLRESGEMDAALYPSYGWLIYFSAKNVPANDVTTKKRLLFDYLKLELPRPDRLHSLILKIAVEIEKTNELQFRIRDFITLWGWDSFTDDDWEQGKSDDGKTFQSQVEKLISAYVKELKTDRVAAPAEFNALVDKALKVYPNNQYMPLYKANVLQSIGETEQALQFYKILILKSPTKFFLWAQAAELVDDIDFEIALLCKAILVEKDEQFIGNCRLKLAKLLIAKGMITEAASQVYTYRDYYLSRGWHLKYEFQAVASQIPAGTVAADPNALYDKYLPVAEDFVYSALLGEVAVKVSEKVEDDRFHPGRKVVKWTLRTAKGLVFIKKPAKFGLDKRLPNGTIINVKMLDGKIVWAAASVEIPRGLNWLKEAESAARIRINKKGQPFMFVNDIYVGANLLAGVKDGDRVKVLALRNDDGSWAAVRRME